MKKLLSIFLLGLYIFALYRPLMPLLDYAANYSYYSEVLCVNKDLPELSCKGQCVLMQKIQAKSEAENPLNKIIISADEEIPEIAPKNLLCMYDRSLSDGFWSLDESHPADGFLDSLIRPPRA